ncbi:hypothetical protein A4R43_34320 [Amycolatopsis albispora]|uniref:Uncharacterized protein n=1 Tax=Amycolatopsis albispora TaxID=1804986 RepID=A0A344LFS8_9PSEU|nr:hypothetical protein A4R43_34320 [Amycolatopsis albispora]
MPQGSALARQPGRSCSWRHCGSGVTGSQLDLGADPARPDLSPPPSNRIGAWTGGRLPTRFAAPAAALPARFAAPPFPVGNLSTAAARRPDPVGTLPARFADPPPRFATLAADLPGPGAHRPSPLADLSAAAGHPVPVADLPGPSINRPGPLADLPAAAAAPPVPVAGLATLVADLPAPVADRPGPLADLSAAVGTLPLSVGGRTAPAVRVPVADLVFPHQSCFCPQKSSDLQPPQAEVVGGQAEQAVGQGALRIQAVRIAFITLSQRGSGPCHRQTVVS